MEANPAEESSPPSNVERILAALSEQATTIQRHDQTLSQIVQILSLQSQASSPQELQQPPDPQPRSMVTLPSEPRLPAPERFDGNPDRIAEDFLPSVLWPFNYNPVAFPLRAVRWPTSLHSSLVRRLTGPQLCVTRNLHLPQTVNSSSWR